LPVSYYTGYTAGGYNGGAFYRSLTPIDATYPYATLSESYNATALNIGLAQTNSDGYDLGFYFIVGTMGSLAANGTTIIGTGFGTNIWINPAAWTWTPIGVGDQFGGLGSSGAYGLGNVFGTQTIDGATTFNDFSGACSGSLTVAAIAAGACPGISASTPVAIWVGITLFSPGTSSGSVSTTAASTSTSSQTSTSTATASTVTSTVTLPGTTTTVTWTVTSTVTSTLASATTTVTTTVTTSATATTTTSTTTSATSSASGGTPQLTVNTEDSSGNAITGYYAVLDQSGNAVATGFSPATFAVSGGQTYVLEVENYGSCIFDHWADTGNTDSQRTFTAASSAQVLTAVYDCGSATTTGGSSTINVSGVDSAGNPISGYYTTLWQNGVMLQSCFTTCSFIVSNGQSYQVMVADFGSSVFSHWTDGTTSRVHTVNVSGTGTTIDLTAVYT
jgi:hypothetical protein